MPEHGPLVEAARSLGADVEVHRDFALRRRYLSPGALPGWAFDVARVAASLAKRHRGRVDLVYVNTVAVPLVPVLGLLGAPVLLHVHERARGSVWQQRLIAAAADRFSDLIVTNSEFTASTLGSVRSPIEVVYNGVDVPAVVADRTLGVGAGEADSTGEPVAPLQVVCVGRLHPKKGQWVLLDAARIAAERGSRPWTVHFFGEALPEHAELKADLIRQADALPWEVVFHGYVADTDDMYRGMDVSVVPSVDPEEFSLVCAESQVRGLPVVTTGPGGAAEVVAHESTGFVVAPDDSRALADRLMALAGDDVLRARLGAEGRRRVEEKFSVDRYADEVGRVVDTLLHT